jgi:hypothetical protein
LLGGEIAALEEFEDDGALEEGVVGKVNDAAAAGADLADELVLLDLASLHQFIIASARAWMMKGRTLNRGSKTKMGLNCDGRKELSGREEMIAA